MATERAEPLPYVYEVQLSLVYSWDMLHVGLEHVGSLHTILHMLWVTSIIYDDSYRLLQLFDL